MFKKVWRKPESVEYLFITAENLNDVIKLVSKTSWQVHQHADGTYYCDSYYDDHVRLIPGDFLVKDGYVFYNYNLEEMYELFIPPAGGFIEEA